MPTYEYRCPAGHDFERFYRKISDASAQVECPECGKVAERLMSVGEFAFKGSGFYLTDYGKNAHRGGAPPKTDSGGGESVTPAAAATGDNASGSKETASATKETASTGSDAKSGSAAKPAVEAKPVKPVSESKPAKSGGSSSSKDK